MLSCAQKTIISYNGAIESAMEQYQTARWISCSHEFPVSCGSLWPAMVFEAIILWTFVDNKTLLRHFSGQNGNKKAPEKPRKP